MEPDAQPRVFGERLTALRGIFGLTQGELAEKLGVSQSFLSHVARGARPMPEKLAVEASTVFGLPVTFFQVRSTPAESGSVTFRKSSRASARDEARVVHLFGEAARIFRGVSEGSGYKVAELPDPAEFDGDAELVAEAMRQSDGLSSNDPVLNVTRYLERIGVGVVDNLDYLDDEAGAHTAISRPSSADDRPLVALVAELPAAVRRLTLLHEAGHLIFDRDLAGPVSSTRSPEEKRAYRFAGAFLLPEQVVRERVSESLNLHGYLPIKADYGLSVGAIIIRARDLRVISPDRARSLQIQLSSQGWRRNEPVAVAYEKPLLFGQALSRVFGRMASQKAADRFGTKPEWLAKWAHMDTPPADSDVPAEVIDFLAVRAQRAERSPT